jgi:hypothetical protein
MLTAAANPGAQEQPNRAAEQADDQRLDDALQHDAPRRAQLLERNDLDVVVSAAHPPVLGTSWWCPRTYAVTRTVASSGVLVHFGNRQRVLFEDPNLVILDARPSAASTRLTAPLVAV